MNCPRQRAGTTGGVPGTVGTLLTRRGGGRRPQLTAHPRTAKYDLRSSSFESSGKVLPWTG